MRTLLITNYWYPWNTSGTFRWLQMGRYIDFDVLTSKKPREGFRDETLPYKIRQGHIRRVFRSGYMLPAVLSGLYLTLRAIFLRNYEVYIFTVPPFTLAFGAYILQLLGRRVVIDSRDNLECKGNRWKLINKISYFFLKKIKYRTTSFYYHDAEATRILSGYNPELKKLPYKWDFCKIDRDLYAAYNYLLSRGYIPDYRTHQKPGYPISSFVNLLYLGFKNLPTDTLHEECINQPVQSWRESAKQMEDYLASIICE